MESTDNPNVNAQAEDGFTDWAEPSDGERIRQSAVNALFKGAETTRQWSKRANGRTARGLGDVSENLDKAATFVANHDAAEMRRNVLAWADRNPERALAVAAAAGLGVGLVLRLALGGRGSHRQGG